MRNNAQASGQDQISNQANLPLSSNNAQASGEDRLFSLPNLPLSSNNAQASGEDRLYSLLNSPHSSNNAQASGEDRLFSRPNLPLSSNNAQASGEDRLFNRPNLHLSSNKAPDSKIERDINLSNHHTTSRNIPGQTRSFNRPNLPSPTSRQTYMENFDFANCRLDTSYERICKIGQGTFGEVFKARDRNDPKKLVAMKKILTDNETEGFPITALREIKILQKLNHVNIVKLLETCRSKPTKQNGFKSTFFLIFEFCDHDLAGILANTNVKFNLGEIKMILKQLFEAIFFLHRSKIMHRDMKAANILVTKIGTLKLADFGLARPFSYKKNNKANAYTNRVVTLWYRPPELLLGENDYGPPIDLWGSGCIMAEFWTRSPIMQGNSEQEQISLICQLCGSITPEVWPGVENYELYKSLILPKDQKRKVKERLKSYIKDPYGCDLLDKLLTLDPSKRIDADKALNHDFFWTEPMPCDLSKMMSQHTQSMFEYLRRFQHRPSQPATKPKLMDNGYRDRIF